MPHRIISSIHAHDVLQGVLWSFLAAYNGAMYFIGLISDADWNRMTGPHGVAFIAVAAVIVLWANGLRKEKAEDRRRDREEQAREARNNQIIAALDQATQTNHELTVDSIRQQGLTAQAIGRMDNTIKRHHIEICEKLEKIER